MSQTAGIKSIYKLNDRFVNELKQAMLLFDFIGVPALDANIEHFYKNHKSGCEHEFIIHELKFLVDHGLLFNISQKSPLKLKPSVDFYSVGKEFEELTQIIRHTNDYTLRYEAMARLGALLLNNEDIDRDFYSIPLVNKLSLPDDIKSTKSDVINIIIENIPIPDIETPWEKIIEFKNNSSNKGKFAGLRTWINKSLKSGLTVQEIKDELEYLLYQYRTSMEVHKIKYNSGILKSIIIGTAETLENTVRLRFSNIAKSLFSATEARAELLQSELSATGKELAYIYETQQKFGK